MPRRTPKHLVSAFLRKERNTGSFACVAALLGSGRQGKDRVSGISNTDTRNFRFTRRRHFLYRRWTQAAIAAIVAVEPGARCEFTCTNAGGDVEDTKMNFFFVD